MPLVKELLSKMIDKIHDKMDRIAVGEEDNGKVLGVVNGKLGLVQMEPELPEGAIAHQQLVTDAEGKTGWEDRLAYKSNNKVEITWDGNTDGLTSIEIGSAFMYKVSPLILTDDQIKAGAFKVSSGFESNFSQFYMDWSVDGAVVSEVIVFVRKENVTYNGVLWEEPGVYFWCAAPYQWVEKFVSEVETIHTITPELITGSELTEADEGKVLAVVDGAFKLVALSELQS